MPFYWIPWVHNQPPRWNSIQFRARRSCNLKPALKRSCKAVFLPAFGFVPVFDISCIIRKAASVARYGPYRCNVSYRLCWALWNVPHGVRLWKDHKSTSEKVGSVTRSDIFRLLVCITNGSIWQNDQCVLSCCVDHACFCFDVYVVISPLILILIMYNTCCHCLTPDFAGRQ